MYKRCFGDLQRSIFKIHQNTTSALLNTIFPTVSINCYSSNSDPSNRPSDRRTLRWGHSSTAARQAVPSCQNTTGTLQIVKWCGLVISVMAVKQTGYLCKDAALVLALKILVWSFSFKERKAGSGHCSITTINSPIGQDTMHEQKHVRLHPAPFGATPCWTAHVERGTSLAACAS